MALAKLEISMLRNLTKLKLEPSPKINLIYGDNGSGKTSLLEAIYLLGIGRSFRSLKASSIIQYEQDRCTVFAEIIDQQNITHKLGVMRDKKGNIQIHLNQQNITKITQLADFLPLQLMDHNSFHLIDGAPKVRRQFIDWGAFHMEPNFIMAWSNINKALQQRNAWLKTSTNANNDIWGHELEQASNKLDQYRSSYLLNLQTAFKQVANQILPDFRLTFTYTRGWDFNKNLSQVLKNSYERDRVLGFTSFGPQKADLLIKAAEQNAVEILSRGQQKLVAYALQLAQGYLLGNNKRMQCVYLVDDLVAELDEAHKKIICNILQDLDCQVFITTTDEQNFNDCWYDSALLSMFHLEHGRIVH